MDAFPATTDRSLERLLSQRAAGRGELAVRLFAGRTRLRTLYQEGAAKIRMPAVEGGWLEAVLINTAGGLTGGDRLGWTIAAETGAEVVVTTQASEKIYRAASGEAQVDVRLSVGDGARLAWLPQETILFDRAAFRRTLDLDLAEGASALLAEATIFGRSARGELVRSGCFRDAWRVRQAGRLVHAEAFAVDGAVCEKLGHAATANGCVAMATVLLVDPQAEAMLERSRALIGEAGGASAWSVGASGKLLARLVADDGYCLRQRLVPLLALLSGRAGLPKTWSL